MHNEFAETVFFILDSFTVYECPTLRSVELGLRSPADLFLTILTHRRTWLVLIQAVLNAGQTIVCYRYRQWPCGMVATADIN